MAEKRKIDTIEDVARELGVSKTTVSRAISGKGRIGQATRERVLQFIEEHDYRPNVMAKGLAQKKTYNLALLLPKDYADTEFPFFKDCMSGICEMASEYDYDVIIAMEDGKDLSQIRRLESNRKVDGMILSRALENSRTQKYLKQCKVPFVVIGPADDAQLHYVDNKNQEASEELTAAMLTRGNRRIALLGGNHLHSVTERRYHGYLDAYRKLGVPLQEELIFMDCDHPKEVSEAVEKILELGADVILCMDDVICLMCLAVLQKKKRSIPDEIQVASFYDSKNLEHNQPSVTSVRFDAVRLGKIAAAKLLQIVGTEPREDVQPLNYQLVFRESTR